MIVSVCKMEAVLKITLLFRFGKEVFCKFAKIEIVEKLKPLFSTQQ
jgi:hypothetical protein